MLIDTPGVIPYREKGKDVTSKHVLMGAIDFSKVKDPEDVIFKIMEDYPNLLQENYDIKSEGEEFLEALALKKNFLSKGSVPDSKRAAVFVLKEWQTGKIKVTAQNN